MRRIKTLSDYPLLIGRLVDAYEARRRLRALPRLRRATWYLQVLLDGACRWLLWPLIKFVIVPVIIGVSLAATAVNILAR